MPSPAPYQVLARKYRPQTFADLIGQDAMVRTLRNAFGAGRIAHAFVLTGVRGVGKTSTARIIAKGLNCTGPDGAGGPTVEPCGVCEACTAIAEGRHVDVLEMDAASRTGVGDIREIIDSVAYRATSARYKVYIIDEVHMLSTSAFNALLKTLEEPPAHVKFLFATTEIRKVPVTVLSRCQRFDLRRIEPEAMAAHLGAIAEAEGVALEEEGLALLVRAAEGSVRDALSLLDQAIAHGGGRVAAAEVRAMLGLADRGRVLDLFEMAMRGDARAALAELRGQYGEGADPAAVLRDLAEAAHWIAVVKIAPEAAADPAVAPDERARGLDYASRLGIPALTRAWALLLKALEEVAAAPDALAAAEMALIRLTHVAELPAPEELVRRLTREGAAAAPGGPEGAAPAASRRPEAAAQTRPEAAAQARPEAAAQARPEAATQARPEAAAPFRPEARAEARAEVGLPSHPAAEPAPRPMAGGPAQAAAPGAQAAPPAAARPDAPARGAPGLALARAEPSAPARAEASPAQQPDALARFQSFDDVLALIRERRDMPLLVGVETGVRLVRFGPGRIEFEPAGAAAADLAARLSGRLAAWTGARWGVSVVGSGGAPTVAEARAAERSALDAEALGHPLVQAVMAAFPGAVIRDVRTAPAAPGLALDFPREVAPGFAPGPGFALGPEDYTDWDPDDPFAEET